MTWLAKDIRQEAKASRRGREDRRPESPELNGGEEVRKRELMKSIEVEESVRRRRREKGRHRCWWLVGGWLVGGDLVAVC